LRRNSAVSGILQHAYSPSVLNLPSDFASELEIVPLVIDRPASIGLHVNRLAYSAEDLVQRLFAGKQTDVRHADQRQTCPSGRAHGSIRTRRADRSRGLTRCHITNELSVANDVRTLRGHSFVVEGESPETRPVRRPCVADCIYNLRTVAQI